MSDSRLEKFIYAICSMEVSDLPAPLSRIETLWNCLITGETPDFEPQSRNELYLMAILELYDVENLPTPLSRGEKLLYKIAVGDTDLSDIPAYLSRYEQLLVNLVENGGFGNFEYVLYTLNTALSTLYLTKEKPIKSAILKGQTLVNIENTLFEGMQSVKMPVLTTTGKNLILRQIFNDDNSLNIYTGVNDITSVVIEGNRMICQGNIDNQLRFRFKGLRLEEGKTYVFSYSNAYMIDTSTGQTEQTYVGMATDSILKPTSTKFGNIAFPKPSSIQKSKYVQLIIEDFQLEEGTVATSYEPFKSNILSTPEEVVLRSLPNGVCDTLNLLTGEYVQRIGEIVLDGSESWSAQNKDDVSTAYECVAFRDLFANSFSSSFVFSNIPHSPNSYAIGTSEGWCIDGHKDIWIRKLNSAVGGSTSNDFKTWLSQNPITVQYELATPTVKTVDLTVVDQDGEPTKLKTFDGVTHVEIGSDQIIPELDLEVATTIEETMTAISLNGDAIDIKQDELVVKVNEQIENIDETMMATTEIYEQTYKEDK